MFGGPCVDPFDLSDASPRLVNIASGAVVSDITRIENSLCSALEKREAMAMLFMSESLSSDNPKSLSDLNISQTSKLL